MTSLVFGRLRVKTRKRPGKGDLNHKAFLQSSAGGKKKNQNLKHALLSFIAFLLDMAFYLFDFFTQNDSK